uniref:Uncharacterized protein n=1 Tax=Gongylonema pulchrum TaxID=637853 RepID=A0A183ESC3_9BILA
LEFFHVRSTSYSILWLIEPTNVSSDPMAATASSYVTNWRQHWHAVAWNWNIRTAVSNWPIVMLNAAGLVRFKKKKKIEYLKI